MINEYETDVETFLFGGLCGNNPYTKIQIDSFSDIDPGIAPGHFKTFEAFCEQVQGFLNIYGWDASEGIAVDSFDCKDESHIQWFDIPEKKVLRQWYEEMKGPRDLRDLEKKMKYIENENLKLPDPFKGITFE